MRGKFPFEQSPEREGIDLQMKCVQVGLGLVEQGLVRWPSETMMGLRDDEEDRFSPLGEHLL